MIDPFLAHVLPLALISPLVNSSVEAAAAAHLSNLRGEAITKATELQCKTLQLLRKHLSRVESEIKDGEQLATASLLLVYYEVCPLQLIRKPHSNNPDHPRLLRESIAMPPPRSPADPRETLQTLPSVQIRPLPIEIVHVLRHHGRLLPPRATIMQLDLKPLRLNTDISARRGP